MTWALLSFEFMPHISLFLELTSHQTALLCCVVFILILFMSFYPTPFSLPPSRPFCVACTLNNPFQLSKTQNGQFLPQWPLSEPLSESDACKGGRSFTCPFTTPFPLLCGSDNVQWLLSYSRLGATRLAPNIMTFVA